jgi:hypothetical protein
MNLSHPVSALPIHPNLVAGSLPTWDQVPAERQQELVQALAALLMALPQLQALREALDEPE